MINIDVLLKAAEYIEKCDAQTASSNSSSSTPSPSNSNNNSLAEISSLSLTSANNLAAISKLCQEKYLNKSDKSIHNTLEKNRRAHLKECFENLQNELPQYKDKKATNLSILNYTLKYVEQSHKKYHENEMEKERLFRKQISLKQRLKRLIFELERENIDYKSILKDSTALTDINFENMDLESLMKMNESGKSEMDKTFLQNNQLNGTSQRKRSSYSLTVTHSSPPPDTDLKEADYDVNFECKKQKLTRHNKNGCANGRHRNYSIDESMISKQKQQNMLDELDSNYEFSNDFEDDDVSSSTADTDADDYNSLNENENSSSESRKSNNNNNNSNDPILVNHDDDVNYNKTSRNSVNSNSSSMIAAKSEFELLLNYGNELRDIYKKCEKVSNNDDDVDLKQPIFLLDAKQIASSQLIVSNKNKIILDEYRMYNTAAAAFKVKKDKFLKEAAPQATSQQHLVCNPLLLKQDTMSSSTTTIINDNDKDDGNSSNLLTLNSNQNKIATNEN